MDVPLSSSPAASSESRGAGSSSSAGAGERPPARTPGKRHDSDLQWPAPTPPAEHPRISFSELQLRTRCGHLHRLRYREKLRIPVGIAAVRGTGVHAAAAHNYRQKVETRRDLRTLEVEGVAAEAVAAGFAGELHLTVDERSVGIKLLRGRMIDVAVEMARAYHNRVAPFVQPLYVEELIRLRPHPDVLAVDLVGRPDVGTVDTVRDIKSKEKEPAPGDEHADDQLTIYAALHKAKTGELPREVGFDVIAAPKRGAARDTPTTTWRPSTRTVEDMRALVAKLGEVYRSIQSGADPPADPTSWWCSPKWCGAWEQCPYVAGRRARGER